MRFKTVIPSLSDTSLVAEVQSQYCRPVHEQVVNFPEKTRHAITMSTVDTIRIPDHQYQERFPIPYCRQHSIRLFVVPPYTAVHIYATEGWASAPTGKHSMTRSLATSISRRVELLSMYPDPTHPVAKRITKAIGSSSIFSLSFMKREKRRPRCGQLRCFHLCLASELHRRMSVEQPVGST